VGVELDAGWTALRDGRWREARACFEHRAGPEALEGLSWAAWWLDDRAAVFDARERAFHGYRAAGDAAGAARMATWLACDRLDFDGAVAVAGGWLARGHRLLDPLEPGPDHGWLAFFDGYFAHAAGDTERSAELARRTSELGRRFAAGDLEMLGLALEGATLVACAQVTDGMRRLDEATAAALDGDAAIPISRAASSSALAPPRATTSAPRPGATGSRSSPRASAAATCSRSAAPSTARWSCGAGAGRRPRRCSRPRSRTTSARAPPGWPSRW
jgi:hypothetical protein